MDKKWIAAIAVVLILIVAAVGVYVYTSGDDDSNVERYYSPGSVFKYQTNGEFENIDTGEVITYEGITTYLMMDEMEGRKQTAIVIEDLETNNGFFKMINYKNGITLPSSLSDKTETIDTIDGKKELHVIDHNQTGSKSYCGDNYIAYKQIEVRTHDKYTGSHTFDLAEYHLAEESECAVFYMGNGSTEYGLCDLVEDGTEVTVPDCSFTYENHAFKGWNTSADGKGTSYAAGSTFEAAGESVTLYAQWETTSYPVGSVLKYQTKGEIEEISTKKVITYEGTTTYIMMDEMRDNSQTEICIQEIKYSNGMNRQLNIQSFMMFPDSLPDKTEIINTPYFGTKELRVEELNDEKIKSKEYYGDGVVYKQTGTSVNSDTIEKYTVDLMGYHLAEESECAVFYMGNGSTEYGLCDLVEDGTEVTVPDCSFTYENHAFKGWNTSADGKGTSYAAGSTFEAAGESVTLYAQWEESK